MRIASGLIAAVFGAALYFGAGPARAQTSVITSFATACVNQAVGTRVTIGPFFTGDTSASTSTSGPSTWTLSTGWIQPGFTAPGIWWPTHTVNDTGTNSDGEQNTWNSAAVNAQPVEADWIGGQNSGAQDSYQDGTTYTEPLGNIAFTLAQSIFVDPNVIDPSSLLVTGWYNADDYVTDILVGAHALDVPIPPSLKAFKDQPQTITDTESQTLGSYFQAGNNTLSFTLDNTSSGMGLYANVSVSATCVAQPASAVTKSVPALGETALLLLAALLGVSTFVVYRRGR